MSLELPHLDACTRRFMLAELQADVAAGLLYLSPQLSASGRSEYQYLLRTAFATGTEASLADDLRASDSVELPDRWQRSGQNDHDGALTAATALLAEREFHRFYIRGLCRRAMEQEFSDPGDLPRQARRGRPRQLRDDGRRHDHGKLAARRPEPRLSHDAAARPAAVP